MCYCVVTLQQIRLSSFSLSLTLSLSISLCFSYSCILTHSRPLSSTQIKLSYLTDFTPPYFISPSSHWHAILDYSAFAKWRFKIYYLPRTTRVTQSFSWRWRFPVSYKQIVSINNPNSICKLHMNIIKREYQFLDHLLSNRKCKILIY